MLIVMARMSFILPPSNKSHKQPIMAIAHKILLYSFNNSIREMCLESFYM